MMSKKEIQRRQKECPKHIKKKTLVTFKDGTRHLEVRCRLCQKFFGYEKQSQNAYDPERIKGLSYDDQIAYEQELFRNGFIA